MLGPASHQSVSGLLLAEIVKDYAGDLLGGFLGTFRKVVKSAKKIKPGRFRPVFFSNLQLARSPENFCGIFWGLPGDLALKNGVFFVHFLWSPFPRKPVSQDTKHEKSSKNI